MRWEEVEVEQRRRRGRRSIHVPELRNAPSVPEGQMCLRGRTTVWCHGWTSQARLWGGDIFLNIPATVVGLAWGKWKELWATIPLRGD